MFLLPFLYDPYPICEINYCVSDYKIPEQTKFMERMLDIKIRWYCRGCEWQNWLYDCSSFISIYLKDKWIIKRRLNSYVFANYWIQINKDKLKRWDLVVIIHWSWNHTTYFEKIQDWEIIIQDTYIYTNRFSKRRLSEVYAWNWQKIYYIWNPIEYWFKESFAKNFRNFLWPNYKQKW